MKYTFLLLLSFLAFSCSNPDGSINTLTSGILPSPDNGGIQLPEKFAALVVVDTMARGRHLVIGENGDIYAHLARPYEGSGIVALRDTSGDGKVDIIKGLSNYPGTGIELHNGYLYFSTSNRVYRSLLNVTDMSLDSKIDTIALLEGERGHSEKPLAFDGEGNMYVTVGSLSNACEQPLRTGNSPGQDPCTELDTRAGIWKFSADSLMQKQTLEKRYASGIRNAVALTWDNASNSLYAAQHGRDDLHRYWPALFTEAQNAELPAEEFFQIDEGDDFGWPYCYWDDFEGKKFLNPEYGGDGKAVGRCEDVKAPVEAFPGHWAPNDVLFYKGSQFPERYKNGAFIAFHGSWNRLNQSQEGFRVVFVPMKDGKAAGPYEDFATGFIGQEAITSPGDAKYRPCGLAEGPDGSLYILDSQKGRIWRVMHYPNGVPKIENGDDGTKAIVSNNDIIPQSEGKKVYEQYCRSCHQANGGGAPGMIPPLTATDWVTGDKTRLINVILKGLSEKVEINGETFQNAMPAMANLSNDEIAHVLTFVRSNFGNKAGPISIEEVAKVRGGETL